MRMAGLWSVWRGSERRREPRQSAPQLVVDSPAIDVSLVDASGSGLGVESERPLRLGVVYPFRVRREGRVSEVYGLVRWCASTRPHHFRAGISVGKTVGPPLSSLAS
jgi:hypothetical protein